MIGEYEDEPLLPDVPKKESKLVSGRSIDRSKLFKYIKEETKFCIKYLQWD
jgi:hypothetical protein